MSNPQKRYSILEVIPKQGDYICLYWQDGSECECIWVGLDQTIVPLPTHWSYVDEKS